MSGTDKYYSADGHPVVMVKPEWLKFMEREREKERERERERETDGVEEIVKKPEQQAVAASAASPTTFSIK